MKPYVTYPFQLLSCVIMLVAFLWLTIGTTFLSVEQQKQLQNQTTSKAETDDGVEKDSTPFENAKEEKTETNPNTLSEEYLREDTDHLSSTHTPLKHNKCHIADAFIAYYGESASEPPEAFLC